MPDSATALTRYEAARRALAEAHRIDEVKDIHDKAVAWGVYAKRAKDREMIETATAIRLHAKRRAGELLIEMSERGEREAHGGDRRSRSTGSTLKLTDLRITKTESSEWQKLVRLDEPAYELRVRLAKKQALSSSVLTKAEIRERRAEREADLGARQCALPDKRYGVLYADPPWAWTAYSSVTGLDRAGEAHYSTLGLDDLKRLDVAAIAAADSVIFLWATAPADDQALALMAAWGFAYKTCFVWAKDRAGAGYWNRNQHELLRVGTRGAIPASAPGTQWRSLIHAPVGRHSEKPAIFYDLIEAYFPTLPRIELFARSRRPGWDAWGLEAPSAAAAE